MSYYLGLPDDLSVAVNGMPEGGANVAQSLSNMLAPPGVGVRYRIWKVTISHFDIGDAPGKFWATLTTTVNIAFDSATGYDGIRWDFPGGLPLPANAALNVTTVSNIANDTLAVCVYYTTEPIT